MEELYPAFRVICAVGVVFGIAMVALTVLQGVFYVKFMHRFLSRRIPPPPPLPKFEREEK